MVGRQQDRVGDESPLTQLGRELSRCRARATRLWRDYQATDENGDAATSAAIHRAWSDAVDGALRISELISREQALDITELVIQLEAVWWWLAEDDGLLDDSARRWLRRFRRSLKRLSEQT